MLRVCQHVSFCLRIFDQVLSQDLLLVQYFHCKELPCLLLFSMHVDSQFLHEVHYAEGTLTQLHDCLEVLRPYKLFVVSALSLQLLIQFPNGYELVLPSAVCLN